MIRSICLRVLGLRVLGLCSLALLWPVIGIAALMAVAVVLLLAVAIFLLLAARIGFCLHFALCLRQHAGVMFGMLLKVFCRNTVIRQLRITRKNLIFFDYLLRCSANLALRARTVKNTIDNIAQGFRAVRLRTRALFA